jgi:hypothetical protein
LIDFGGQRGLHDTVCAKFFRCNDALAANSVNAKRDPRGAKIVLQKRVLAKIPAMKKALFHRAFLNFSDARTNDRRVSLARAIDFDFDRETMQSYVALRAHTRFVKR